MIGEPSRDPLSLRDPPRSLPDRGPGGGGHSRSPGAAGLGITPVEPKSSRSASAPRPRFAEAGVAVEEAHPDLSECHDTFQVLRARSFVARSREHLEHDRELLKPEIVWNVEHGLALTGRDVVRAETQRWQMFQSTLAFFEEYDLLLTPATIVLPFPVEQRYVASCAGHEFGNYVEWLAIAYAVTLVCCPALSLPCGFSAEGLPFGLQLVAPPRGEARLLAGARLLEEILELRNRVPIDPRPEDAARKV